MGQETIEELSKEVVSNAKKLGCTDVSVVITRDLTRLIRIANNRVTLASSVVDTSVQVYLAYQTRRVMGVTHDTTPQSLERFVSRLVDSASRLAPSDDYAPLPSGPFDYPGEQNYDKKLEDEELVEHAHQAVDAAQKAGASRVAGSLEGVLRRVYVYTSAGAAAEDAHTKILLNVRAFTENNASGHGLSCASFLSEFNPEKAGRAAGEYAKMAEGPKQLEAGTYDVIFTPTVVANILPLGDAASAYLIESGVSYLSDQLNQQVGVESLNVWDYGVFKGGLGGRRVDDEGVPTQKTEIIVNGVFRNMLHNTSTAKKFGTKTTGNAGIISPQPHTVVFGEGDSTLDEMIKETKRGLLVTNNWYTRFQNLRTGEYSTLPRDASFSVINGKIGEPVAGFRLSDSVLRQLKSISLISKTRNWIEWWEVDTPTFAPYILIKDVNATTAY
ncbi:MAG: TldD/PmbA family protein [Thermoprotei archaeon]